MQALYDDIRLIAHGIWRRRWLALAVAWAICLAGWLVVALIPNRYESQARLFVQTQALLPDQTGASEAAQQKEIDRVRQTLASAVNLEKVVRGTDLNLTVASDRDMASRIEALRRTIRIVAQQDNLFQIVASSAASGLSDDENARLARAIVQKLIDLFVEENLAGGRADSRQALAFLDAQLAERARQLQAAEARKLAFEAEFLGALPGTGSVAERMDAARSELGRIDAELAAAQSALGAVGAQMAATAPTIAGAGAVAGPARARLAALEAQIADGRARGWTDQHPDMVAMRNQLAAARAAAQAEPVVGGGAAANPMFVSLRAMQAERQAAVAALATRRAQIHGDMQRYVALTDADPAEAAEAGRQARDYGVLKDQYDKLLAEREQASLRDQMESETDATRVRVVDPPSLPHLPVAPNRPLLLTLVLAVGLAGGAGAAFLLNQLRASFATAERLEAVSGLPVIGAVGHVETEAGRGEAARRMRWFAGGGAALAGAYALLLLVEFVQRGLVA
ncbi:XrtA system polysaccharide chain length determinant [Sphingomonas flavalba]|uniref:XrtA system polysaccharide chain length determinant n=1 Tax=Sphingomonas flavalba TaxID=2559804 RepID=UPI00109DB253|nr:XrtA system polysaccharide chain length determinant [Sphingomonas flavalba]